MDLNFETIKIILGILIASFVSHLGGTEKQLFVLLFLITIDTIAGWSVAKYNKEWTSSKARWGFMGKIVELMFIAMLYLLDWALELNILKYIGIYYFGICEIASVVESFSKINKDVPQGLVDVYCIHDSRFRHHPLRYQESHQH